MTLHEAIVVVLRDCGRTMKTQEIADELNRRELYRKRDGSPITAYQIHGRTKNYSDLFTRDGSLVALKGMNMKPVAPASSNPPLATQERSAPLSDQVDFTLPATLALQNLGFSKLITIGEAFKHGWPRVAALEACGLYAITTPDNYQVTFLALDVVAPKKNVIRPWTTDRLERKWISNTNLVYFGLAGSRSPRSIRSRLGDLLRHGQGRTSDRGPHKGGEILWQLEGYDTFTVWICPTNDPPEPRVFEEKLLRTFASQMGGLPFANRQR